MIRELIATVLLIVFFAASLVLSTNVAEPPGTRGGEGKPIVLLQEDSSPAATAPSTQPIVQISGRDLAMSDRLRQMYGQARQAVSNLKL